MANAMGMALAEFERQAEACSRTDNQGGDAL